MWEKYLNLMIIAIVFLGSSIFGLKAMLGTQNDRDSYSVVGGIFVFTTLLLGLYFFRDVIL